MKFVIKNINTEIEMTKKLAGEAFICINNQLDNYESRELLEIILPMLNKAKLEELLNYCCERFPVQTSISLEENGIIEEE